MLLSMNEWRHLPGHAALLLAMFGCGSSGTPVESAGAAGSSANGGGGQNLGGASASSGGVHDPTPSAGAGGTGTTRGGASGAGAPSLGGESGCAREDDGRTTLVFVNGCDATVTFRGSDIPGGTLALGASSCVDIGSDVEPLSSKRYWGFRGEDPGAEHYTLAEFTFNTDFHDFDWYNISHVDAFNLPLQILPIARPDCQVLTCADDLVSDCPTAGRFENSKGEPVACVSPDRDDPMSPVALYFESCDDAYAWSGDDQYGDDSSPMKACAGEDWQIRFCPEKP
jgi:Thaumatin family